MTEQTPTAGLTAILAEHQRLRNTAASHGWCSCGARWLSPSEHHAHVAEQITAAGFGPVRAVEAEWDLAAQVREACDAAGVPHDVGGLIRHHRGNAATAAAMDAVAVEAERDALREGMRRVLDDELANLADDGARLSHSVVRRMEAVLDASPDREGFHCESCGSDTHDALACTDREGSDQ